MTTYNLMSNVRTNKMRDIIRYCKSQDHKQQVAFSVHHDALTQVCFTCEYIRTTIGDLNE